jgi:hypothetical protein
MSLFGYSIYAGGWWGNGFGLPLSGGEAPRPANPDKPAKPGDPKKRPATFGGAGGGLLLVPPGYAKAPPGGYYWWWVMSAHPTLAFLQAVVTDTLLAGTRTCKVRDEGGKAVGRPGPVTGDGVITSPQDKWAEQLDAAYKRHWPTLLTSACRKLQFGHAHVEKVYGRIGDAVLPVRFKPWRPWEIGVRYDAYGDYAGVRYNNADVDPRYAVPFVNESDLYPLTGRPRLENAREEWWEKVTAKGKGMALDNKASGIIPIVKGPASDDGLAKSKLIAAAIARGEPVFMPRYLFDDDTMASAATGGHDASTYEAYEIDTVDVGDTAAHASSILEKCRYLDSEMAYAYLVPPRAAMEGQYGTKAEAGVHGQVAVQGMERLHAEVVAEVNAGSVRADTVTNRGPAEADRYGFEAAPLADPQQENLQKVVDTLMANPAASPALVQTLDLLALLRRAELPVDPQAPDPRQQIAADKQQQDQAKADALKAKAAGGFGGPPAGANSNGRLAGVA